MKAHQTKGHLQAQKDNSLLLACEGHNLDLLRELIAKGANPKTCSHQAIIWACYNKNWKTTQELLKHYKPKELGKLKNIIKKRLGSKLNKEIEKSLDSIFSKKIMESVSETTKILEF